MARVRERVRIPLATNMCIIDLDSAAEGLTLGSADVILGDIFEWGGIGAMLKLKGSVRAFQVNLNYHSSGELGIATAAYLHLAAATPALPHALDTHVTELAGDVVKPGVIGLTARGTMPVPDGPGLGVELDADLFAAAAEAHRRAGDQSVYAEDDDARRRHSGQVDVVRAKRADPGNRNHRAPLSHALSADLCARPLPDP